MTVVTFQIRIESKHRFLFFVGGLDDVFDQMVFMAREREFICHNFERLILIFLLLSTLPPPLVTHLQVDFLLVYVYMFPAQHHTFETLVTIGANVGLVSVVSDHVPLEQRRRRVLLPANLAPVIPDTLMVERVFLEGVRRTVRFVALVAFELLLPLVQQHVPIQVGHFGELGAADVTLELLAASAIRVRLRGSHRQQSVGGVEERLLHHRLHRFLLELTAVRLLAVGLGLLHRTEPLVAIETFVLRTLLLRVPPTTTRLE
jgi:hypothetical protein